MRRFVLRFANLFRKRRAEREMAREIAAHLALVKEDFERRGLSPEEAALAARRVYGGVEQAKELHRESRSFVWIEQLFKDLRYAWSSLMRHPGFTLFVVLALALGIGPNASFFAIYNAIALKQLPVADPGRVVRVKRWFDLHNFIGSAQYIFAYPEYEFLRDRNHVFSGVTAAFGPIAIPVTMAGKSRERLIGQLVSANYFGDLGVKARAGRTFLPDEDRSLGGNTVVVISHRYWQQAFHGDPNAIGQTVKLWDTAYTIVGVAPAEFTGTLIVPVQVDFWAPLSMTAQLYPVFNAAPGSDWRGQWRDSTHTGFDLLARLKPGVSRAQAQAETDVLMRQARFGREEARRTTSVTLSRTTYMLDTDDYRFHFLAASVLLFVSLVLLVACANVANMLLARGVARQREIGIRLALGAGRGRIIRQLLTESMLLSFIGGTAGLLLSVCASKLMWISLTRIPVPTLEVLDLTGLNLAPDAHILIFGLGLSLLTGIMFGLVPALQFARPDLYAAMKGTTSPVGHHSRARSLLLGAQVSVSVLLLLIAGDAAGSLAKSNPAGGLGFEARDTYVANGDYDDPAQGQSFERRLRAKLETLPEVSHEVSSAAMGNVPMYGGFSSRLTAGKWSGPSSASYASDAYFETLGVGLVRGRSFTRQEADRGAPIAVISEATARLVWPHEDPLGKSFTIQVSVTGAERPASTVEVVGVVKDIRFDEVTQIDPSHVYLPAGTANGNLMFRISGDHKRALAAVQSIAESVDRRMALGLNLVSIEKGPVAMQRGFDRLVTAAWATLTLLSVTLAGIGIFGVMAFLVSQRTREIGIRVALGATSPVVIKNVVMQGLRPVLIGMAIGIAAAMGYFLLTDADAGLWHTVILNPLTYAELALMAAIAALASVIPARRALDVDPIVALRYE